LEGPPVFVVENSQMFIHKLCVFLNYSNHKQIFLFKAVASITSAPPLEKSWLRPWTCPYVDNLEFDIFHAGGLQCYFITSVTIAVM